MTTPSDWDEVEEEPDNDPPPASMCGIDPIEPWPHDPAPLGIAHRETPELHLRNVARQNVWIEGLHWLNGEAIDHRPIEVLDSEMSH